MVKTEQHPSKQELREIIQKNLESAKNEKNLHQKDFAIVTGLSEAASSKWFNGEKTPSHEAILKIANGLDISIEYLYGRSKMMNPKVSMQSLQKITEKTEKALENLTAIRNDYSAEILSALLESEHFKEIVKCLFEINELCNDVSDRSYSMNDSGLQMYTRKQHYDFLPDLIRSLKYGRYELTEHIFAIMNEIIPVEETISTANKAIDQYKSENEE